MSFADTVVNQYGVGLRQMFMWEKGRLVCGFSQADFIDMDSPWAGTVGLTESEFLLFHLARLAMGQEFPNIDERLLNFRREKELGRLVPELITRLGDIKRELTGGQVAQMNQAMQLVSGSDYVVSSMGLAQILVATDPSLIEADLNMVLDVMGRFNLLNRIRSGQQK